MPLELAVEPANITLLALHVLAQRTERRKLFGTPRERTRAPILLLLVRGTREVLVQRTEQAEFAVTQEAFVRVPVPGPLRRPRLHLRLPSVVSDHPLRVRDDVPWAVPVSVLVEQSAREAGGAGARLHVEDESGTGDEHPVAVLARTVDVRGGMYAGAQVVPQIVLVVEDAAAIWAVVMALPVVLVKAKLVGEHLREVADYKESEQESRQDGSPDVPFCIWHRSNAPLRSAPPARPHRRSARRILGNSGALERRPSAASADRTSGSPCCRGSRCYAR